MAEQSTTVRLIVGDCRLQDTGESVARLSNKAITTLALERGDRVQIRGKSSLLALALPAGPEDDELDLIRLDAAQRRQLGTALGERVEVRRYTPNAARFIQLTAVGNLKGADFSSDDIREALSGGQVMVGDTLTVTPDGRVFEAHLSLLGIQLASVAGSSSDTRGVLLRVASTEPQGVVEVTSATEIEVVPAGAEGT